LQDPDDGEMPYETLEGEPLLFSHIAKGLHQFGESPRAGVQRYADRVQQGGVPHHDMRWLFVLIQHDANKMLALMPVQRVQRKKAV